MIKRALKALVITIIVAVLLFAFRIYYIFNITPFDTPWLLSSQQKTIDVSHINWACDCADFIETKNYTNNEANPDSCIFIEPSDPSLKTDDNFYTTLRFRKNLRLTGRFFIDKGIAKSYSLKTPEKPDPSRVFLYDKIEYVDK